MSPLTFTDEETRKLFGHEAAEDEDINRLRQYYFKTSIYEQVINDLSLRLLVGHKGIGKSALFQVAMQEDQENNRIAILIKPDDIAEISTNDQDFLKCIRDWKTGLLSIITSKVLRSLGKESSELKSNFLNYGGKVIEFLKDTFKSLLSKEINLNPTQRLIIEHFIHSGNVKIYIDDLDRGWAGRSADIRRISALMNAVRDLSTEHRGLCFRVALRSDVYFLYRTSDESTDKIEGSVVWHSWNNHEIFALLVKRIESFYDRDKDEKSLLEMPQNNLAIYLNVVFEERFNGSGHWQNAPMYRVLMSLIRKRPRDLIKLCTLAARHARNRRANKISTASLQESFEEYSHGRLQDTINEFRSELPDIERLLINMKPSRKERTAQQAYKYNYASLLSKINNIIQQGRFTFSNNRVAEAKQLAAFMYKINFLTARKETEDGIDRKYFEENRYLLSDFADYGYDWEIHPAYRWALQPDRIEDIFKNIELSTD